MTKWINLDTDLIEKFKIDLLIDIKVFFFDLLIEKNGQIQPKIGQN